MKTKYLIENKIPEEMVYEEAKKKVDSIKAFYCHLVVYVLVNFGLFLIINGIFDKK